MKIHYLQISYNLLIYCLLFFSENTICIYHDLFLTYNSLSAYINHMFKFSIKITSLARCENPPPLDLKQIAQITLRQYPQPFHLISIYIVLKKNEKVMGKHQKRNFTVGKIFVRDLWYLNEITMKTNHYSSMIIQNSYFRKFCQSHVRHVE